MIKKLLSDILSRIHFLKVVLFNKTLNNSVSLIVVSIHHAPMKVATEKDSKRQESENLRRI